MTNKIRMKVFADGDHVGNKEFDQDVVKIGSLSSSNLRLNGDGVARMHAVLERSGDMWRIIDLGSMSGCVLDGVKVDKNAALPLTGELRIGSFRIDYELDHAPQIDPPRSERSESVSYSADPHHTKLFDSLLEELEKVSPNEAKSVAKYKGSNRTLWQFLGEDRRRQLLRLMVKGIRTGRSDNKRFVRHQVASMLNLGPEGLEAVYDLSPEEALDKAHESLLTIHNAKAGLEALSKLNLAGVVEQGAADTHLPDAEGAAERFRKGHAALEDRLQRTVAGSVTLLVAYLSRAGGEELTEEDRKKWREQYAQIEKLAKEIAEEDQRGQLSVIS